MDQNEIKSIEEVMFSGTVISAFLGCIASQILQLPGPQREKDGSSEFLLRLVERMDRRFDQLELWEEKEQLTLLKVALHLEVTRLNQR